MNVAEALDCATPAWFDGTHLYRTSGKHEWDPATNRWKKLHDLTMGGLLRWFDPSFQHNAAMAEAYQAQQRVEEEKQRKQELAREAARLENERWQRRDNGIDVYIKAQQVRGKRQTIQIQLGRKREPVSAMVYGALATHHTNKLHNVTHVPTGLSLGQFSSATNARRYVKAIKGLCAWENILKCEDVPAETRRLCVLLRKYCNHEGLEIEQIDQLADFLGVPA